LAVVLSGYALTLDDVVAVARNGVLVELAADSAERIRRGRAIVEAALADDAEVYGLTTGVGVRKRTRVDPAELAEFNRRLILEHRVGQGEPAPTDVARAQLLLVANGFARGTSGVRIELAEHLVARLNAGVEPRVRVLGSIGMADLPANADLAHDVLDGFELAAKEGLSLLGSNAFSTASGALALVDALRLARTLDVAALLDLEALAGNVSPLRADPDLGALLEGSYLWEARPPSLQDPLSFRCIPQVRAAMRDALAFARRRVERELNASQENPLVLVDEGRIVSVGDFDALPLAQALDVARLGLVPALTSAAERTVKLLQSPVTGLPEGLAAEPGLAESGLSEFGVPAQALATEAKLLAQPVSVETASTSHHEGIEDRITLAPLAARRLAELVALGERLAAIELVVAAQAVDLRGRPRLGAATAAIYERVRAVIPATGRGEPPPQDLEPVRELVRTNELPPPL
jgi:histidine ammonia-lyase